LVPYPSTTVCLRADQDASDGCSVDATIYHALDPQITRELCVAPDRGIEESGSFSIRLHEPVLPHDIRPEVDDILVVEAEKDALGDRGLGLCRRTPPRTASGHNGSFQFEQSRKRAAMRWRGWVS